MSKRIIPNFDFTETSAQPGVGEDHTIARENKNNLSPVKFNEYERLINLLCTAVGDYDIMLSHSSITPSSKQRPSSLSEAIETLWESLNGRISAFTSTVSMSPRQGVLMGNTDEDGLGEFLGTMDEATKVAIIIPTTGESHEIREVLLSISNGYLQSLPVDYIVSISSTTDVLTAEDMAVGTNYLYFDYDAYTLAGSCNGAFGFSTNAPLYARALPSTPEVGQHVFLFPQLKMYEYTDTDGWQHRLRVYIGEADVIDSGGHIVTAVRSYTRHVNSFFMNDDGSLSLNAGGTDKSIILNPSGTGVAHITSEVDASSSVTGSLTVDGGVGIAKKLYVGNSLSVGGTSEFSGLTTHSSGSTHNGLLTANAGANLSTASIVSDDEAASPTDAPLKSAGGLGVAKSARIAQNLHVGGDSALGDASDDLTTVRGRLTVEDANQGVSSLRLGADVDLYRSGENTLATPDNAIIDGNVTVKGQVDIDNFASASYLKVDGTIKPGTAGYFYAGTTDPTGTDRLNYDGYFYATRVYNAMWNDIAECMPSDGLLAPRQLAAVDLNCETFRVTQYRGGEPESILGVIAENPGFVVGWNETYEHPVLVALAGMVWLDIPSTYISGKQLYRKYIRGRHLYVDEHGELTQTRPEVGRLLGVVLEQNGGKIRIFVKQ